MCENTSGVTARFCSLALCSRKSRLGRGGAGSANRRTRVTQYDVGQAGHTHAREHATMHGAAGAFGFARTGCALASPLSAYCTLTVKVVRWTLSKILCTALWGLGNGGSG